MSKKKNEAPFDYLKSIITANIPDYNLFYSFKQIKTAITNTNERIMVWTKIKNLD